MKNKESNIGYLIGNFPKLSETFVYREVENLRNQGLEIKTYSFGYQISNTEKTAQLTGLIESTRYLGIGESLRKLAIAPLRFLKIIKPAIQLQKSATNKPSLLPLLARAILVADCIKKDNISHLHIHWPYATMVGYLAAKLANVSYSISVHAHEVVHENGHFAATIPHAKFVSFCNEAALIKVKTDLGKLVNPTRFHLNYHGVNCDHFAFKEMQPVKDNIELVTIGRLTEQKGFEKLIEICADVNKKDISVNLTIVGGGEAQTKLIELASSLDFAQNLHITGWVKHQRVKEYIYKSHIFILIAPPSHQGLPNVVLESMACGRPVILSPLPTVQEIIAQNRGGWLLEPPRYNQQLQKILENCVSNKNVLVTKGLQARKIITEKYADKVHIKNMAKLFNEPN